MGNAKLKSRVRDIMAKRRVAVVTGGASGIGEATVKRLAADGYDLAILDRTVAGAEALATSLATGDRRARAYACDVADANDVDAVAARVATDLGPATVLVTSAGLIPNTESVMDMDMVAHERMWAVNYHGTVHCCRSFGRQMIPEKRGAIVTLGSINSAMPLPLPAYNPGKAAVVRLTQLLAVELGRHGIRVNSVGPTYVMTPPLKAKVASGERDMNKIMAVHALPTLPVPADIADAIAFLCSDQARAITGVLLPVDAGWLSAVSYRTYAGGVPWDE
jgi:NAD(P)-dependent dehydrogenase (short-subunit alcohol dehydrogenase family)